MLTSSVRKFLFPNLNTKFFLRLILLALCCYVIFGHILIPLKIQGMSMEPTYKDRSFAFCWRPSYLFGSPQRFDIVGVRFAGRKVMLMKRIVAFGGETVEFRKGFLYVDGKIIDEPYVKYRKEWELPSRTVKAGYVYVVGDNRGTSIARHQFGETHVNRIVGTIIP